MLLPVSFMSHCLVLDALLLFQPFSSTRSCLSGGQVVEDHVRPGGGPPVSGSVAVQAGSLPLN